MAAISPSLFHKIASVSGALAIALGAYGAHGIFFGLNYAHVLVFHWTHERQENFLYGAVNCHSQIAEHHLQTNHHIDLNSIQQNTTNYLL